MSAKRNSNVDEGFELESPAHGVGTSDNDFESARHGSDERSMPPTDTGKDALLFLAASFLTEGLVWGASSS